MWLLLLQLCGFIIRDLKIWNKKLTRKIDINKYYKQLQRLRDSYHIARFSLENTDNVKLVIDYLITTNKNSNR